jgi:UDP-GlcNAc3NAcA epimerase
MKRVLSIVGARPQFIKAAPVSLAFENLGIEEFLIHTGQHYDERMSDVFFQQLGIRAPEENLDIGSGKHGDQTGRMLAALERCIERKRPDCVLVYGDTNSTIAGALAAAKLDVKIAHVEAGLRSFNRTMPEEVNRVVTDCLADYLFAPTHDACLNLRDEGIDDNKIFNTGDVMLDAVKLFAQSNESITDVRSKYRADGRPLILATIHRAANTDDRDRLCGIVKALIAIAQRANLVIPVHPRTKKRLEQFEIEFLGRIVMLPPVGYSEMLALQRAADLVLTDSGGIQKEAFFNSVPCVTIREETEWVELVQLGWNTLVNPDDSEAIISTVFEKIGTKGENANPYGDGDAAGKIAKHILEFSAV